MGMNGGRGAKPYPGPDSDVFVDVSMCGCCESVDTSPGQAKHMANGTWHMADATRPVCPAPTTPTHRQQSFPHLTNQLQLYDL